MDARRAGDGGGKGDITPLAVGQGAVDGKGAINSFGGVPLVRLYARLGSDARNDITQGTAVGERGVISSG